MIAVPPSAPEITPEDELLAAELAFGLLDAADRTAAERRLGDDAAFAAAHRRWLDRAVGLFVDADVVPPPGMWAAIVARLPANDVIGRADVRLRRWQWTSAAAAVLAVVSTTALLIRPAPISPPRVTSGRLPIELRRALVAILASPERPASVAVGFDPLDNRLTVLPSRLSPGAHSTELWVIPGDGTPRSLGVILADAPSDHIASDSAATLIVPGATLAVSVEPVGGSPTGKPTGPVILTGPVRTG